MHPQRSSQRFAFPVHKGFTLIEVLITIAIISILAMVSVPLYQNYEVRVKVGSEFPLMHPLMLRMNEEYALNDRWPSNNKEAGGGEPSDYMGDYLKSAEVSENPQPGTMTLTYDANALPVLRGTDTLVFYPAGENNNIRWACNKGTIPEKYRPPNCR